MQGHRLGSPQVREGKPMQVSQGATDNQFIIHSDKQQAEAAITKALGAIGKVTQSDPSSGAIRGSVKYGLNKVKIDLSYFEEDGKTIVTAKTRDGSIQKGPGISVVNRLKEGIVNDTNPGYQADRRGMSTSAIVGSVALFLVLFFVVWIILVGF